MTPVPPADARDAHGLTAADADRRLAEFGPNLVETGSRLRLLRTGLGLLANPLVVILLVASIVTYLGIVQVLKRHFYASSGLTA